MTKRQNATSGSALPVILIVLILAAVGVGAWLYMSKAPKDTDAAVVADVADVPAETVAETAAEITQDVPVGEPNTPSTPSAAETATAPATEAVDEGPVAIDVAKAMGIRAIGNPNAPIKVIEYASLTCSHCAHFHNDILPELKTKFIDTGKVYLEFREFPLNDPALKATIAARCLPEDKYEGFVGLLFKTQDQWAGGLDYMQALRQNAKLAGLSDATFDACQNSAEIKTAIAANMQEAQDKWKLASTPTFIINDGAEIISGAQPVAEFERLFRKVSGGAVGEAPAVE